MSQKLPLHEVLLRRLAQGDTSAVAPLKSTRAPHLASRLRNIMLSAPTTYARVLAAEVLGAVGGPEDVAYIAEVAVNARDPNLTRGLTLLLATLADKWTPDTLNHIEALARRTDPQVKRAVTNGLFIYTVGGGAGGREAIERVLPLMPPECASTLRRALALTCC